ncbi:MAG: heme exporter protein CcmB [Sphingomonas sp.]
MRLLLALVARDLGIAWRGGGAVLPIVFFLLVATLFPFAIGPDGVLLARAGGGALWMAALLAALLPVDRLIAPDRESGVLDQLAVRGIARETIAIGRIVAHWLSFGPPLLLAAFPAAALLRLETATLLRLLAGLALGTPGLAALAVATSALTASLRAGGALTGLLMLPLAIPVLIFGAGALGESGGGGLKLLAATSLMLVAASPFVAAAALRAGED